MISHLRRIFAELRYDIVRFVLTSCYRNVTAAVNHILRYRMMPGLTFTHHCLLLTVYTQRVIGIDIFHEGDAPVTVCDLIDGADPVADHRFGGIVPGVVQALCSQ